MMTLSSPSKGHLYRDSFTVSWFRQVPVTTSVATAGSYARSDRKDHRSIELCPKTIHEIKRQARENGSISHFSHWW